MQNFVTQKKEEMIRQKSSEYTLKNLSAKPMLILVCSLGTLALFTLVKIIITAVSAEMNPFLTSVYFFAGEHAEPFIDSVAGLFIFVFLGFLTFSAFQIYNGGKKNDDKTAKAGLHMLKGTLIYAMIILIVFILVSLASVSVMYQAAAIARNVHENDIASTFNAARYASVGGMNSYSLFTCTVFFGIILIASILIFSHFISAVSKTLLGQSTGIASSIASMIISCIGVFVFFLLFFKSLADLVMPSEIGTTIQFAYVWGAITDVIITGALTASFGTLIFLVFRFQSGLQAAQRTIDPYFGSPYTYPPTTNQGRPPQQPPVTQHRSTVDSGSDSEKSSKKPQNDPEPSQNMEKEKENKQQ